MKEATGELNMTVIVVVAIVAIGALFTAFVYPVIKSGLLQQTCKTYGSTYKAVDGCCVDSNDSTNKICPDEEKTTK